MPDLVRLGLLGGSFDPPHVAHQQVCLAALALGRLDEVLVVPCYQHAFDKQLTDYAHRLEMCRLACEPFDDRVQVSDVERQLGGVSRTLVTVEHLHRTRPGVRCTLIVGADILPELPRWFGWDRLQTLVDLFVVGRGAEASPQAFSLPDISSTAIRKRLRAGEGVEGWVPASVLDYIAAHGLYGSCARPEARSSPR
jgi:nicotinate-nucleotide adenylyltransferase